MVSELRHATILFADIAGFTAAAAKLHPEVLTDAMNPCFAVMAAVVREHGGHVDKFIGDCVMAIFGAPAALENAPRQAVNAAIEIRNQLEQLGRERRSLMSTKVHIGINSGLVRIGDVGGDHTITAMGDPVNVASRIKDHTPTGAIWVGRQTHAQTRLDFEYRGLEPIDAKGKDEPVEVWEVLSTTPRVHRTATVGSEMVGRQQEFAKLVGHVQRLRSGEGGVVAVRGEAGIGKSRLLAELLAAGVVQGTIALQGRSLAMGANLRFHPFVDLLRRWAGIAEGEPDVQALPKFEAAVRELVPDTFEEVFPFVATLMGFRLTGARAARVEGIGEGEALEELIFQKVHDLVRRLSHQQPLLLVFEDFHWADRSSIKLAESLLRLVTRHAILLVLVGRLESPETLDHVVERAGAQLPGRVLELALARLTDAECEALIRNLLGGEDLPYPVRARIIGRADGNPFFVEEAVRSMIDDGAVVRRDGRFHVTEKIESVVVPASIEGLIMARIERLEEETRGVLQVAAVVGRFFQRRILADYLGSGVPLDLHLQTLIDRELVVPRSSHGTSIARRLRLEPEQEYVFKHALLQEVVYEAMLQRTRLEMHRRVAEAIERLFADRLNDFYPMLAYHYARADLPAKAEEYLFKAGEEAARTAASNEALAFFREASRLYLQLHGGGGDPQRKAHLEKNIALALLNTGHLTESIEHFDRALGHFGVGGVGGSARRYLTFLADVLGVLVHFYVRRHRPRRVADWEVEREIFQTLLNRGRAEITSDQTRLFLDSVGVLHRVTRVDATQIDQASIVYACAGSVFGYAGRSFDVTRRALDAAKRLIRPASIRDQFICASMEFIFNYLRGDWDEHFVIDPALVAEALRFGQLWDVNTYLGLYCDRRLRQGDYRAAGKLLRELGELTDTYGFSFAGANHDITEALWLLEQRRLPEALPRIEAYHSARHEDALKVLGLGTQAKAQTLLGDFGGAAASLVAAERITSRSQAISPWHLSAYAAARVRYDVREVENIGAGRPLPRSVKSRVVRNARFALRVASRVAVQRTEIHQLVGRLWCLLGNRRKALAEWRLAIGVGTALRARPELARTWDEIGRSLIEADDPAFTFDGLSGDVCCDRAAAIFADIGIEWDHSCARTVGRAAF